MSSRRVAVIGAGMTGMTAAYRLGLAGAACDVYERWPGLGGQVATLDVGGGHLLERYYHHLFETDHHIADLCEELGMDDAIEWLPSSVAVFAEGARYAFTTPLDLLRFRPLSVRSRLRMGLAVVLLQRRVTDVAEVEDMTAREWIEAKMGSEVWQVLWGPLLAGKFGSRADDVSMAWLWSKLTLRRRVEGRGAGRERLGYPRGGWQPLLERLREQIEAAGGRVLIDRPVAEVDLSGEPAAGRFRVEWGAPDSFRRGHDPASYERAGSDSYDDVIATVPNPVFEALLGDRLTTAVGTGYLDRVRSVEYHAALCLLLELDRPFGRDYWTNVVDRSLPFVGLIDQARLVGEERYDGRNFLYVANYVEAGDELLGLDPDELLARYEPGLRAVNPEFSAAWVRERWLFREPDAQPIVDVGYAERRMPALATGVEGLVLANTTQVYPEDRGTNYAVRLAGDAVSALAASGAR